MKVKNKRVLKNGAVAGYVYYSKDKKWKWRIIGHTKKMKGGEEINNIINCKLSRVSYITAQDLSCLSLLLRQKHTNASSINFVYNNMYNFIHKHIMAINNNNNKSYNNVFVDFAKKYRKRIQQSFNKIQAKKYSNKQILNIMNIVSLFNFLTKKVDGISEITHTNTTI
jgi:hypothetical protein